MPIPTPENFWNTVNRIEKTLSLSPAEMATFMGVTLKDYEKLKLQKRDPKITVAMNLVTALDLSLEGLLNGDIDFKALNQHYNGNQSYIPEKYITGASSKRRTVINLLNYIEMRFGWEMRALFLNRFQMNESMFSNPDDVISLRFTIEAANWIHKSFHGNQSVLMDLGKNATQTYKQLPLGQTLSKSRNLHELYEMMVFEVIEKFLEKNFIWEIKAILPEKIILRGWPNKDIVHAVGENYLFSKLGCVIRQGFFASMPRYLNRPDAIINKTACVSENHKYCEFELDLTPSIRAFKHIPVRIVA